MAIEYNNNQDFSIKLRHITALAFLPSEEILKAFNQVKLILPENTTGVIEYFEENYICERTRRIKNKFTRHLPSLFLPKIWSINDFVELDYSRI